MNNFHYNSLCFVADVRVAGPDFPWLELLRSGARVVRGTSVHAKIDDPTTPEEPGLTMQTCPIAPEHAHLRSPLSDIRSLLGGGTNESTRVTFRDALATCTANAAYAGFVDKSLGRLETGFLADFVILEIGSLDELVSLEERWLPEVVHSTFVGGKRVFSKLDPPDVVGGEQAAAEPGLTAGGSVGEAGRTTAVPPGVDPSEKKVDATGILNGGNPMTFLELKKHLPADLKDSQLIHYWTEELESSLDGAASRQELPPKAPVEPAKPPPRERPPWEQRTRLETGSSGRRGSDASSSASSSSFSLGAAAGAGVGEQYRRGKNSMLHSIQARAASVPAWPRLSSMNFSERRELIFHPSGRAVPAGRSRQRRRVFCSPVRTVRFARDYRSEKERIEVGVQFCQGLVQEREGAARGGPILKGGLELVQNS